MILKKKEKGKKFFLNDCQINNVEKNRKLPLSSSTVLTIQLKSISGGINFWVKIYLGI